MKDFAYTEYISIKEALDVALEHFPQVTNNLLPHNRERRDNTEIIRLDDEKIYSGKLKAKKFADTFPIPLPMPREFNGNFSLLN